MLFQKFFFSVTTANSGNEAWALLQKQKFDLVLTDVRMPNGDGLDLALKIRARHPSVPSILFMSGYSDLMNEEIFHIGAEGKFSKPFDNIAVRSAIETCLMLPSLRWRSEAPLKKQKIHIECAGESIESLALENKLLFGRGGFFVSYNKNPPEKQTIISFEIKLTKPTPITLAGNGIVRWSHARSRTGINAGLGIELYQMPDAASNLFHRFFSELTSFIPSPYRLTEPEK